MLLHHADRDSENILKGTSAKIDDSTVKTFYRSAFYTSTNFYIHVYFLHTKPADMFL